MYFGYEADRRKRNKAMGKDYLWFGLFGQWMGLVLIVSAPEPLSAPVFAGELALVLCTGVLIGGCAKFARYHQIWPGWAFLGLFNLAGVLALLVLCAPAVGEKRGKGFSVIFAEPYRRDVWRMDIRVVLDESTGAGVREPIMLQVPRGCNVGTALKTLAGVIPELADGDLPQARFTLNGQPVGRREELSNGDELTVSVQHQAAALERSN
jgi:hypothetical protein